MNKLSTHSLVFIGVIILICLAGRCDYNETVIYNMPDNTYQAIKTKLGEDCSESQLVDEYQENKKSWDSIAFDCEYK